MATAQKLPKGITLRANGTHQIRFRHEGRQHAETFGPGRAGLAEARKRLTTIRAEKANGKYRPAADVTLGEHWARFTALKTGSAQPWASSTASMYRATLAKVPAALLDKRLSDVTVDDVVLWQGGLRRSGLALSTVRLSTTHLGAVFTHAMGASLIERSPVRSAETRIARKGRSIDASEVPSGAELARIQAELPEHLRVVVLLGVLTLRAGEIRGCQVQDLDLSDPDRPVLHVRRQQVRNRESSGRESSGEPKHGSARVVTIVTVPMAAALQAHIDRFTSGGLTEPLVHHLGTAQPLDSNALDYQFRRAAEAAGLGRFHLHSLRHHAAVTMLDAGVPIPEVAAQMGHSVEMTSTTYLHRAHGAEDRARTAMAKTGSELFNTGT